MLFIYLLLFLVISFSVEVPRQPTPQIFEPLDPVGSEIEFGFAVAIDNQAQSSYAITAIMDDPEPSIDDYDAYYGTGAVWIVTENQVREKKTGVEGTQLDRYFGGSVSMENGYVVTGDFRANLLNGQLFIFKGDQLQTLDPDVTSARFGGSASIRNGVIAVGARFDDNRRGRVYVYKLNQGVWELYQRNLTGTAELSDFGDEVELDADASHLVVSAPRADPAGLVFVYEDDGERFVLAQTLNGTDPSLNPGSRLATSADARCVLATDQGKTLFFEDGSLKQTLNVGQDVAVDQACLKLAVCSTTSCFIYGRPGGAWVSQREFAGFSQVGSMDLSNDGRRILIGDTGQNKTFLYNL